MNDPMHCQHTFKRISWTAIFVGALIGLGLGFLLNLFGIAIGLSLFTLNQDGSVVLAVGGLLGLLIGIISSMVVAGYAAGYLGRLYCPKRNLGIVYGFTTWVVALLLAAVMAGQVGHYVEAYTENLTHTMAPAVTQQDTNTNSDEANNAAVIKTTDKNETETNVPAATLAWVAFTVFILFFVGAVSTCAGACWGMNCKREDE
ncbi:hypothetical protein [Legionella cardiaca]|uniref:Transmembrane protein n=1 Tax=Legionella cardiaca TaxID=1071983 RepID=A0ABY8AUD7_9GAMM|nr:hypothetical protein [Legionella cardiaca]WED42996.1 hypothetical protein PXX05_14020 [Legionella cardiaca]